MKPPSYRSGYYETVVKKPSRKGSKAVVTAVAARDLDGVRRLLPSGKTAAIPAAAMVKAGQMA